MASDPLLSTETKITLVFMFFGLTAWYLATEYANSDVLELAALFGIGIVLPTLLNERRRHSRME
ncbi:hypothetical protein [Haloarcula sebkhae]|uniref:Uncharacterized protein n=1 Tax=Haloarcula sebkhae TaxID=932660 RepID=A0ACC6VRR5_9EURY|nr:hypothetical protein [Haloarcula sebkhae]